MGADIRNPFRLAPVSKLVSETPLAPVFERVHKLEPPLYQAFDHRPQPRSRSSMALGKAEKKDDPRFAEASVIRDMPVASFSCALSLVSMGEGIFNGLRRVTVLGSGRCELPQRLLAQ